MRIAILFLGLFVTQIYAADKSRNLEFDNVLKKYESLHQAFFDEKIDAMKSGAKNLIKAIDAVKDEKIMKVLATAKKNLAIVADSSSLMKSKKAFNTASKGLIVVLEKHAPNKAYAKYYCPMVKKYWIQNITESEKVMNPYASKSMPHCGGKQ